MRVTKIIITRLSPLRPLYRPRKILFSRARKRKSALVMLVIIAALSVVAPLRVRAQTVETACKKLIVTGSVVDDDLTINVARSAAIGESDTPAKWIVTYPHDLSAAEYQSVTLCETK